MLSREDLRRQYLQLDKAVQAAVFASLHNLPTMLQACQAYLITNFSQVLAMLLPRLSPILPAASPKRSLQASSWTLPIIQ